MAITILPPTVEADHYHNPSEDESRDSDSDIDMDNALRPSKRLRISDKNDAIVTPGEIVTDDPQWMR